MERADTAAERVSELLLAIVTQRDNVRQSGEVLVNGRWHSVPNIAQKALAQVVEKDAEIARLTAHRDECCAEGRQFYEQMIRAIDARTEAEEQLTWARAEVATLREENETLKAERDLLVRSIDMLVGHRP